MTLYLFKYFLPVLLGYTLFVGLSGRLNPLAKPEQLEQRPSWFLGLWTGISVVIVTVVGLHMAYSMTLEGVRALLPPTALFMAVLLIPGFLAYFHYRRVVTRELQASRTIGASLDMHRSAATVAQTGLDGKVPEIGNGSENHPGLASDSIHNAQDTMRTKDTDAPVVSTFFGTTDLQTLDTHHQDAANHASTPYDPGYMASSDPAQEDYLDETIFEELHYSALDLDEAILADLVLTDSDTHPEPALHQGEDADRQPDTKQILESADVVSEASDDWSSPIPGADFVAEVQYEEEILIDSERTETDNEVNYLFEPEAYSAGDPVNPWFDLDDMIDDEKNDQQEAELFEAKSAVQMERITDNASFLSELELLESDLRFDDTPPGIIEDRDHNLVESIDRLAITPAAMDADLMAERSSHQETARQLYASRKVLATLTSGAEGAESDQTATFLQMREELSQRRNQQEALEGLVQQEGSKRLELESSVAELQRNLIMSKQDVRRSTAARAKALGTANKAIAFARQTLQVRALLEEELNQVRETLTCRQSTISSLINELEYEKDRTQEEVSFMVQQLVLHEQQLKARRKLNVAAENIDSTLPIHAPKRIETHSLSSDM